VTLSANATSSATSNYNFYFTCDNGFGTKHINGPSDGLTNGAGPGAGQSPADPNLDCGLYQNGTTVASGAGPLDW
jgi:hypothetical protein